MTTSATLKYTHLSPQKMRLIADQIRGMSADRAVTLLSFSNKKGAKIVKKGNHITVVSFSYAILEVLKCLKILKSFKINIELIDLRTLRPLDHKTIINSVKKLEDYLL